MRRNIHLCLKNPTCKISVTIKAEYSSIRREIERRLQDREVIKEDAKKILCFIDDKSDEIYLDNYEDTATSETNTDNGNDKNDKNDSDDKRETENKNC